MNHRLPRSFWLTSFHQKPVLHRIINWPRQKALKRRTESRGLPWIRNNRKWRDVATFVTFFHGGQWRISFPFSPDIYTNQLFHPNRCARHPFIRSTIFVIPILSSRHFVQVSIEKSEKNEAISSGVASVFQI